MTIEIVDLPSKHCDFPISFLLRFTRGYTAQVISFKIPGDHYPMSLHDKLFLTVTFLKNLHPRNIYLGGKPI